jgi:hypothetical protein
MITCTYVHVLARCQQVETRGVLQQLDQVLDLVVELALQPEIMQQE